jgi:hypothetical protein
MAETAATELRSGDEAEEESEEKEREPSRRGPILVPDGAAPHCRTCLRAAR